MRNYTKDNNISYCSKEENKVDVPFNPEFIKEICIELNKSFGISIAGYDFIMSTKNENEL